MVIIVERGKGYRPNIPPFEGPIRVFTPEELERRAVEQKERERISKEFWDNFHPVFPNGEEAEPVVDRQTLVAFLTWGHPLYVTPSAVYGYVYVNDDKTSYRVKLVGEKHTRESLARLENFRRSDK